MTRMFVPLGPKRPPKHLKFEISTLELARNSGIEELELQGINLLFPSLKIEANPSFKFLNSSRDCYDQFIVYILRVRTGICFSRNMWKTMPLFVQLQSDNQRLSGETEIKFQLEKDALETMLKSMYSIRDQWSNGAQASKVGNIDIQIIHTFIFCLIFYWSFFLNPRMVHQMEPHNNQKQLELKAEETMNNEISYSDY